jgi:coenzyme F420-reducing hydrogenase gamma subunit
MLPHDCPKPCTWPGCLTEAEIADLAADVAKDFEGCPTCEMIVSDCEMYGCPRNPDSVKAVEFLRKHFDLVVENQKLSAKNIAQGLRVAQLEQQLQNLIEAIGDPGARSEPDA